MKTTIISVLTAVGITLVLSLPSPSANAHPCTYGSYHDYATNTTHYYWFHDGEYVGSSISPDAPPPACQPH